jgi:GTP-binding protein HflX
MEHNTGFDGFELALIDRMTENNLDTPIERMRAILIAVYGNQIGFEQAQEYLAELDFLTRSAGAQVVKTLTLSLAKPRAGTYLGSGKIEELKQLVIQLDADVLIFDDDLTPTQVRNLEKLTECRILDRSGLILQIFSERARTAQAKTQVQVAQLQYILPRLTRMWSHLSRERGGTGLKGTGEQQIELDRRMIRERIARLKKQLEKIDQQNETRRKHRESIVRVALVGYTNVGKSTLMNRLAKSDVLAENKLFATLDTTVRKVMLDGLPILLSDTVGFIRKLPTTLIESFKSTLDEVREADLLLHVVDVSSVRYIEHLRVVRQTLAELGAADKPTLMVFNKIDLLDDNERHELEANWHFNESTPAVFISATNKIHLDNLRETLYQLVREQYRLKYPSLEHYYRY